jgi:NAD-dependent SIR2 family protein deacetylase
MVKVVSSSSTKSKTVFILGAGFSVGAGAPSQENLVGKIFEINSTNPYVFEDGKVKFFQKFLERTMNIPVALQKQVPLEDIFTPLDRCLIDNMSFRDLNIHEIKETRGIIYYLIGQTLNHILRTSDKGYIDTFAKYLANESSKRMNHQYRNFDPVSVISTNWDILLDNSIKHEIDNNFKDSAVVDYCCYISSFRKEDTSIIPGLEMLGKGGFNVKLIKLHGSLNWLQCPRCHRLYVEFDEKIAMRQFNDNVTCRHCDKNFNKTKLSHKLTSNLIMPTFLKDLSNPQYKIIWQNAGIELSEADKIVFIGYSLPQADFEMRQLLSRMVRSKASIEVVDYGENTNPKIMEMKQRYKTFFGSRDIAFFQKGAIDYILSNYA